MQFRKANKLLGAFCPSKI